MRTAARPPKQVLGSAARQPDPSFACRNPSAANVSSWRDAYFRWKQASRQSGAVAPLPGAPRAQTAQEGWRSQYYSWRAQPYAPPRTAADAAPPAHRDGLDAARERLADARPPPLPSRSGPPAASRAFSTSSVVPFNLRPTSYRVVDGRLMPLHGAGASDGGADISAGAPSDAECLQVRAHPPLQPPRVRQQLRRRKAPPDGPSAGA